MGVGVSVLRVQCDFDCWKSRIKLLCQKTTVFVVLLGPYIGSRARFSILWSLIRRQEHVYEHGRESSRRISDS